MVATSKHSTSAQRLQCRKWAHVHQRNKLLCRLPRDSSSPPRQFFLFATRAGSGYALPVLFPDSEHNVPDSVSRHGQSAWDVLQVSEERAACDIFAAVVRHCQSDVCYWGPLFESDKRRVAKRYNGRKLLLFKSLSAIRRK